MANFLDVLNLSRNSFSGASAGAYASAYAGAGIGEYNPSFSLLGPQEDDDISSLLPLIMMFMSGGLGGSPRFSALSKTPEEIQAEKRTAEINAKTAEIKKLTDGEKFSLKALQDLKGDTPAKQYDKTVDTIYNFGILRANGGATPTNGPFKNQNVNHIKTQALLDNKLFDKDWNWDSKDLEAEFGSKFGTLGAKSKFTNLKAIVDVNSAWHSTPFHLAMAQSFLNEARDVEKFIKAHESASSNTASSENPLSELKQQAKDLRERAALHYQIGKTTTSPIALDTDGNGQIDLTSVKDGVQFDIDGDGKKDQVAWTQAKGAKTDSWLALDRDGNGKIDSGKELFGNQHGMANGYQELKKFDANADGVIDKRDAVYSQLRSWQDLNHDGISQSNELLTLDQAGIESVQLSYNESKNTDAFGNELRQQSGFVRSDAKAAEIAQTRGISKEAAKLGLSIDAWLRTILGKTQ